MEKRILPLCGRYSYVERDYYKSAFLGKQSIRTPGNLLISQTVVACHYTHRHYSSLEPAMVVEFLFVCRHLPTDKKQSHSVLSVSLW